MVALGQRAPLRATTDAATPPAASDLLVPLPAEPLAASGYADVAKTVVFVYYTSLTAWVHLGPAAVASVRPIPFLAPVVRFPPSPLTLPQLPPTPLRAGARDVRRQPGGRPRWVDGGAAG